MVIRYLLIASRSSEIPSSVQLLGEEYESSVNEWPSRFERSKRSFYYSAICTAMLLRA